MQEQWQKDQAAKCPCRGSDEMCPCQNQRPEDRRPSAEALLEWMTYHHLPLQLCREEEGAWVVVDNSTNHVLGSGETAEEAIHTAHKRDKPDAPAVFFHAKRDPLICPGGDTHEFSGWREFEDGRGGETVCKRCGIGAMEHSLALECLASRKEQCEGRY